jgi:hypothetical protein
LADSEGLRVASIIPFLPHRGFDDAATKVMGEAFDAACTRLGEISDAARESVAGGIIAAAKTGERDPIRLCDAGIAAVVPKAS